MLGVTGPVLSFRPGLNRYHTVPFLSSSTPLLHSKASWGLCYFHTLNQLHVACQWATSWTEKFPAPDHQTRKETVIELREHNVQVHPSSDRWPWDRACSNKVIQINSIIIPNHHLSKKKKLTNFLKIRKDSFSSLVFNRVKDFQEAKLWVRRCCHHLQEVICWYRR